MATRAFRESQIPVGGITPAGVEPAAPARSHWTDPRYQAYALMRLLFTVAPIAFGVDKFANVLVDWRDTWPPGSTTLRPATPSSSCTS